MSRRTSAGEVLVVYRKSKLTLYVKDKGNKRISRLVDDEAPSVAHLVPAHEAHSQTLASVKSTLKALSIPFRSCYRARLRAEDVGGRLVVTVGGDGTVLDASHRVAEARLLGVNSDPERSVGFLCAATRENFGELVQQALAGDLLAKPVPRLSGSLDDKPLPFFVLNDLLVAHRNPAATVRYTLAVGDDVEEHKSSGVWIAAPAGSTAAIASAGGRVQRLDEKRYQVRVREPYLVDDQQHRLLDLMLAADQSAILSSRMGQGVVYLDGPHVALPFPIGAELHVSLQAPPLHLFVTDAMNARRERLRDRRPH